MWPHYRIGAMSARRPPIVGRYTAEEVELAARNHGMPLEALRYDVTPAGLHYLLIHYDIPPAAADTWRLTVDGLVDAPVTASRYRPSTATRSGSSCPAGTAWHT